MDSRFAKSIITGILVLLLITSTGFQPARAVDKSRVFVWLLFCSGLGSSVAGTILQSQANETYDMYLHTAVQANMDKHIDDYDRKHQQSVIASRAGIGLVISAILLSLVDAAHITPPEAQETPVLFGWDDQIINTHTRNGEILLTIGSRF